jgi:hypothetical protein
MSRPAETPRTADKNFTTYLLGSLLPNLAFQANSILYRLALVVSLGLGGLGSAPGPQNTHKYKSNTDETPQIAPPKKTPVTMNKAYVIVSLQSLNQLPNWNATGNIPSLSLPLIWCAMIGPLSPPVVPPSPLMQVWLIPLS